MSEERHNERDVRMRKVSLLENFGIEPYAQSFDKKILIGDIIGRYEKTLTWSSPFRDSDSIVSSWFQDHSTNFIKTAGRLTLIRTHGKLSFARLMDETGDVQLMFHASSCVIAQLRDGKETARLESLISCDGETLSAYKFVERLLDIGDRIGVEWELFYTHKGELTIFVSCFSFLAKAIRPLWDKFHGIGDHKELSYRQRYLDMIFNSDVMRRMKLRSTFVKTLRDFYHEQWFVELDTPILWFSASGAAAEPFVTHHKDFDIDMYLRIAPEIALKIATVGGLEKVFEIGKDFRNEWSSPSHHQEFLVAEHYAVYRNYEDNMKFTEQMFDYLFTHIPELKYVVKIPDKEWHVRDVDFHTPWERIDYVAQVKLDSGIDVSLYNEEDAAKLRRDIRSAGFDWHGLSEQSTATMIDYLYKKVTRPKIIWPAFVYNYPKTMQPLARVSDTNSQLVEQFQLVVNGWEITKAYGELVNPIQQQANFDAQFLALEKWDAEATSGDDEFVKAMEYGMPPQSGWGMGIDRILALLTEQSNIRDVIMFPMMKPERLEQTDEWISQHEETPLTVPTSSLSGESPAGDLSAPAVCSLEDAKMLAHRYLSDTLLHCQQVAHVMRYFAVKLWLSSDQKDYWYIVWLLHDVDWDVIAKDPAQHLWEKFLSIVSEISASDDLVNDIRSHYLKWGIPADSLVRQYLLSVDELSGLLFAYSRMRPEWFEGMQWSSINKKIKDKAFAAGVDREHVRNCEHYLWIALHDFAMDVVEAMKSFVV